MNPKTFFDTVVKMRQAQREYFKTRTKISLERGRRYELAIDAEIDRVRTALETPRLID